jgi:hypothetical protein
MSTYSVQHLRDSTNATCTTLRCAELRIRDILDGVGVMTNGIVAAYELSGIHSYYHTEECGTERRVS